MGDQRWLSERFEEHRPRLKAVAFRMLGSFSEADDAVQEAWIRLSRSDQAAIDNLSSWLTTVVARICLDLLRSRKSRAEDAFGVQLPDGVGAQTAERGPEDEALLADSLGLALLVVLDVLSPAERLAFVLHDLFKVPFEEISELLNRSPDAAKMLASRARRRVRGVAAADGAPLSRQREVTRAFIAAARGGDLSALIRVLDPDVELEVHFADGTVRTARGAAVVAGRAFGYRDLANQAWPAFLDGTIGIYTVRDREPVSAMRLRINRDAVTRIEITLSPERLRRMKVVVLN